MTQIYAEVLSVVQRQSVPNIFMKKLFGTDGIRGIAGKYPFEADVVKRIGYAAAMVVNNSPKKEFVIGCDTRESSSWISNAVAEGIMSAGVSVFDCGVISTPAISYITSRRGSSAGCVISASHNLSEFNGIKFFSSDGIKISDGKELEISIKIIIFAKSIIKSI